MSLCILGVNNAYCRGSALFDDSDGMAHELTLAGVCSNCGNLWGIFAPFDGWALLNHTATWHLRACGNYYYHFNTLWYKYGV